MDILLRSVSYDHVAYIEVIRQTEVVLDYPPLIIDKYHPNTILEKIVDLPWELMTEILDYSVMFYLRNCCFSAAIDLIFINSRYMKYYYRKMTNGYFCASNLRIIERISGTIELLFRTVDRQSKRNGFYQDKFFAMHLSPRKSSQHLLLHPWEVKLSGYSLRKSKYISDNKEVFLETVSTTAEIHGTAYLEAESSLAGYLFHVNNIYRPVITFVFPKIVYGKVDFDSWLYFENVLRSIYDKKKDRFKPLILYREEISEDKSFKFLKDIAYIKKKIKRKRYENIFD